jgi:hypothetical protein
VNPRCQHLTGAWPYPPQRWRELATHHQHPTIDSSSIGVSHGTAANCGELEGTMAMSLAFRAKSTTLGTGMSPSVRRANGRSELMWYDSCQNRDKRNSCGVNRRTTPCTYQEDTDKKD